MTGPSVGVTSKGLQPDNLFGAGSRGSLHEVACKVELLDMSRYCQWDNQGLECMVGVVAASAVPPVRNRWTIAVGTTVVCRAVGAPNQLQDMVGRMRPYPSPSLSNGSHSCH